LSFYYQKTITMAMRNMADMVAVVALSAKVLVIASETFVALVSVLQLI
jgi:hypothetical protein